ncbi:MAG: NAD(P)-binding protein, partial [Deltaproteobacteria bacterium]|nr:NAD(P)-binding protein [Deltaproteobacteria bacterium]
MENRTFSTWGNWSQSSREINSTELPAAFDEERPLKAFMGWDGMFILDNSIDIVDMTREYITHAAANSCGQCSSCRNGMDRLKTVVEKICDGRGTEADLDQMEYLARFIKDSSKCDIGLTTPLPVLDSIENYREEFLSVIQNQAPVPRGDYVAKVTAPCVNACPSHVDIPSYVEKIRDGRWEEALEIVRKDCPMPGTIGRICVRPCEFNCRRGLMDEPIAIKSLKRFAADREIAASAEPEAPEIEFKEDKVAIIGAGPAGLSCAYNLGLRGYKTTIFEDMREPGGMAATGIPDYRLPRDILRREAEIVQKVGAEIRYNVNVGEDITLEDLTNEGYKAIFVGVGAPESSKMRCEGEDEGYMCFMTGIEFLRL